ncbi:MAG TPA: Lsm family RNA-binding protein [Nitrososphaeraceae archaeon]|jgi:small nuclear ribonucleoprotein (snRNP)-like protein
MSALTIRKFYEEILQFVGKKVSVETTYEKNYSGILTAIDEKLNTVLENIEGQGILRIIINGSFLKEIKLLEKPFDLKGLADRLSRVFPGLVKIRDDVNAIIVMDKIKVTEHGVEEGTGLSADRVKSIYEEFMREFKR